MIADIVILVLVLGYGAYIVYNRFVCKKGGGCGCSGCSGCTGGSCSGCSSCFPDKKLTGKGREKSGGN